MNYKLINYNGIDDIESIDIDNNYTFNIEGDILINEEIEDILSFSVSKEIIESKKINVFEDVNYEGYEVNSNLIIITIKYDIIIEYSNKEYNYRVNAINKIIYKTLFFKDEDFNYSRVSAYTIDILCRENNKNEIYYYIHGCILF